MYFTPSISYLFIILPVEGCSANSRKLVFFKSFSQRSFFKFYKMFYPGCGPSIFSHNTFSLTSQTKHSYQKAHIQILSKMAVDYARIVKTLWTGLLSTSWNIKVNYTRREIKWENAKLSKFVLITLMEIKCHFMFFADGILRLKSSIHICYRYMWCNNG